MFFRELNIEKMDFVKPLSWEFLLVAGHTLNFSVQIPNFGWAILTVIQDFLSNLLLLPDLSWFLNFESIFAFWREDLSNSSFQNFFG